MPELELSTIRNALNKAQELDVKVVSIRVGETRFDAQLGAGVAHHSFPEPSLFTEEPEIPAVLDDTVTLRASLVGYWSFGKSPILSGHVLEAGQKIGEIKALGLPNDQLAKVGGTVEEILVAEGEAVEFDQPIMVVRTQ